MNKQEVLVKIIFLRKLGKEQKGNTQALQFGRIPLLVNKYETFPNLCNSEFQTLLFPVTYSRTVIKFNTYTYQQSAFQAHTNKFSQLCRSIQISNNQFIAVCGCKNVGQSDRLSIVSEEQVQEFTTLQQRYGTCVCLNKKMNILFIMGGRSDEYLSKCETFNYKTYQQKEISEMPIKVEGASAQLIKDTILVFGGKGDTLINSIQAYNINQDS